MNIAAAYDGERLPILLYLPRHARPPFQAVVFFPGSDLFMQKEDEATSLELSMFDFIVKSGRAVVLPVYKGALERNDKESSAARRSDETFGTRRWANYMVKVVKDFTRALDYLETRSDIDHAKIGYYGFSEGGIGPSPCSPWRAGDSRRPSVTSAAFQLRRRFPSPTRSTM